ncbi:hypothetical protein SAMN05444266_110139 [Chitinophaga jiangningensis]|uniref:Uncharacterized protein n=1 Tax=Chitinophaga jiangningensis TaxID=1419482 RepID=A0A1M7L571_9BACT|nr:hypothetical protein SAMN05444266_110139 [Chitinophaga jiangningensis]
MCNVHYWLRNFRSSLKNSEIIIAIPYIRNTQTANNQTTKTFADKPFITISFHFNGLAY